VTTTDRPRAPCPKTRARQRPGPLFIHQHGLSLDDELEERLQAAALAARLAPIALVRSATPLGGLAPLEPGRSQVIEHPGQRRPQRQRGGLIHET